MLWRLWLLVVSDRGTKGTRCCSGQLKRDVTLLLGHDWWWKALAGQDINWGWVGGGGDWERKRKEARWEGWQLDGGLGVLQQRPAGRGNSSHLNFSKSVKKIFNYVQEQSCTLNFPNIQGWNWTYLIAKNCVWVPNRTSHRLTCSGTYFSWLSTQAAEKTPPSIFTQITPGYFLKSNTTPPNPSSWSCTHSLAMLDGNLLSWVLFVFKVSLDFRNAGKLIWFWCLGALTLSWLMAWDKTI